MARELRQTMMKKPWMEVAPSLLDFTQKPSIIPKLETILEDIDEDFDAEEDGIANL
ncbi:hypothetical protein TanjilG_30203 [Lupinus angustifolius]|uniref:Uncharacterized protein n=1 Tax=Lupinus angustifolius TaxID=3871 RepID=A0A4P1R6Q9_LUPAN|nr:hypothetical protein TanjilG_30203 [Lupinus angustifolius]